MDLDLVPGSVFRYQKSVRCIAITDICIALFMLAFFGLRIFTSHSYITQELYPPRISTGNGTVIYAGPDHVPNLFILVCICVFSVYSLQLLMGQVLLSATYKDDKEVVLSRCQKWYWSSQFLNVMLGIELFTLVFSTRGGTPAALGMLVMKIIFRAIANHMVKIFMWDLRSHPPPFPLPLPTSHLARITRIHMPRHRDNGEFPTPGNLPLPPIPIYEPPPSYAEAIREKNFPQDFNNVV